MSAIINERRRGFYLDSVALMRMARSLRALPGIEDAGLMIGTPANKVILAEANLLADEGRDADPGDLVIAVRARDEQTAEAALAEARRLLDAPRSGGTASAGSDWQPRSIRAAKAENPSANLALISVPGVFAASEARKALAAGLDVMIFSDNVAIADEIALKQEASALGRLVMGPDCGTAIIAGVPLGFANAVPRGDIAIVGASGTGTQEISCLIAQAGHGISHAIGTGGRDLKQEVGAVSTLAALDRLDQDPSTRHVVLVSKPPSAQIARRVIERIGRSAKSFTVCFLGAEELSLPANARQAHTLAEAAALASGQTVETTVPQPIRMAERGRWIAGLYSGGTLCGEAQVVLAGAGLAIRSNVAVSSGIAPGSISDMAVAHTLIDMGADEFTQGRPHPMIDPSARDLAVRSALELPDVAVVVVDIVLGTGGHPDPAGHLAAAIVGVLRPPVIIASVTGTEADPQVRSRQVATLQRAGIVVAPSNRAAAMMALAAIARRP